METQADGGKRPDDNGAEEDVEAARNRVRSKVPTSPGSRGSRSRSKIHFTTGDDAAEENDHFIAKTTPIVDKVADDALRKVRSELVDFFACGQAASGEAHGDERETQMFPTDTCSEPPSGFPAIKCTKGFKGKHDKTPNQDNFSMTYCKSGHTILCCMDGHGHDGHHCATRAVELVPHFLLSSSHFPATMDKALEEAFLKTQDEMVAAAHADAWSCFDSGTTAAAVVIFGPKVWIATVGDSRVVIGSGTSRKVLFESVDHKPLDDDEAKRIVAQGGEIRSHTYSEKFTSHRIYLEGTDQPGLSMARSLGDCICKPDIVSAQPTVHECDLDFSLMPFIILASDGIWEFMASDQVVKEVAKKIKSEGPDKIVERLCQQSLKLWQEKEDFAYVDDITGMLFIFKSPES